MNVFNNYARYYDLLYKEKDYKNEADYIQKLLQKYAPDSQNILEMGCGTGKHGVFLAERGYSIHGVDLSELMLEEALTKHRTLSPEVAQRLTYSLGDVRTLRLERPFDVVISLFHVMSYQTTNEDLRAAFETVKRHLKPGGVFIFDCWYGPCVLTDRPHVRVKTLEDETIEVTRIAQPKMDFNANLVEVDYHVLIKDKISKKLEELKETHTMRYLFRPEVEFLLNHAGMKVEKVMEFMTDKQPGHDTWSVCFVGRLSGE